MDKYTCIIIEDEPLALEKTKGFVEKVPFLHLSATFDNALTGLNYLNNNKVDLLFLDIQMPHITGVEFLRALRNPPKVIFTTAFEHYAIQGFELDVMDYLLKPISYDRFLKAAWKARDYFAIKEQPQNAAPYIFVKTNGKLEKITFADILFIEGMENYVAIYLENKKIITHTTIKSLLEKLPGNQFIQSHKSYVVAMDKIDSIEGNTLHVQSYQVPVSKYLREEVLGKIVK